MKPDVVQQAVDVAQKMVPTTDEQFVTKEKELQRGRAKMRLIRHNSHDRHAGH